MDNNNKYKKMQLEESPGKARHKLFTLILYNLVVETNKNNCFRCGLPILSADSISIDHKIPWMYTSNPKEIYYSIDNIAFSHKKCNSSYTRGRSIVNNPNGFKGITYVKRNSPKKFRACGQINGKRATLGYFLTAEEAARAYDLHVTNTMGNRAVTNESLGLFNK